MDDLENTNSSKSELKLNLFDRAKFGQILKELVPYRQKRLNNIPRKYVVLMYAILEIMDQVSTDDIMYNLAVTEIRDRFGTRILPQSNTIQFFMLIYRLPETRTVSVLLYPDDIYRYPNTDLGSFVYIFVAPNFGGFSWMDIVRLQELQIDQIAIAFESHRLILETLPPVQIQAIINNNWEWIRQIRDRVWFQRTLFEQLMEEI